MYEGIVPFDTKQKVFVCEVIMSAALDRIECILPPDTDEVSWKRNGGLLADGANRAWISSAKEVAGMGLATFYAQIMNDGMTIQDALDLSGFERAVDRFVERRSKQFAPLRVGELTQFDCRKYAEKFVRAAFKVRIHRTPAPTSEHAASGRNRRVTCASGLKGWQGRLRDQYRSFAEFEARCMTYGLAARLGFSSARHAWDANPMVRGSVEPSDYQRVDTGEFKRTGSTGKLTSAVKMKRRTRSIVCTIVDDVEGKG